MARTYLVKRPEPSVVGNPQKLKQWFERATQQIFQAGKGMGVVERRQCKMPDGTIKQIRNGDLSPIEEALENHFNLRVPLPGRAV